MTEIPLDSGAVLNVGLADLDDASALFDAVIGQAIGVKIPGLEGGDLSQLFSGDISMLKDLAFKVITSKEVRAAVLKCMAYSTYQPPGGNAALKITKDTFQPEKTRGDFFPVAGEVAVFNLTPFFRNLKLPSSLRSAPEPTGSAPAPSTG